MAEELKTPQDMEAALAKMTEDQREHLRLVISSIIGCYLSDAQHGLVLVTSDNDDYMKAISINATDMEAASILNAADTVLNFRLMEEAPAKEMLN